VSDVDGSAKLKLIQVWTASAGRPMTYDHHHEEPIRRRGGEPDRAAGARSLPPRFSDVPCCLLLVRSWALTSPPRPTIDQVARPRSSY
jgi:hypothetical protein